ncbi:MAG: beta-hydroxyacyl-ACP dehydratase [Planctomycetes bacterium]|nr:beta-hydroxyacyl-ACP dehydratase [Planctomycetota bacterium]
MNQDEISQIIGVKEPYLWLDETVTLTDRRIHARKYLDPLLPLFQAHFVTFPLFPGALQCEAAFQAASLLIAGLVPVKPGHVPVIARVKNVKFRRMARPGDWLDIDVEIVDRAAHAFSLRGRISVAGKTTTELDFVATEAALPLEAHSAVPAD